MKQMKKILALSLALVLLASLCVSVSAETAENHIVHLEGVDVIFEETSSLSAEAKQRVAEQLVYGESSVTTYGLMCTLFGHKTTTEIVTTISHRVNATSPRCLEETWQVVTCSRCDYTESTCIASSMIDCCT